MPVPRVDEACLEGAVAVPQWCDVARLPDLAGCCLHRHVRPPLRTYLVEGPLRGELLDSFRKGTFGAFGEARAAEVLDGVRCQRKQALPTAASKCFVALRYLGQCPLLRRGIARVVGRTSRRATRDVIRRLYGVVCKRRTSVSRERRLVHEGKSGPGSYDCGCGSFVT